MCNIEAYPRNLIKKIKLDFDTMISDDRFIIDSGRETSNFMLS